MTVLLSLFYREICAFTVRLGFVVLTGSLIYTVGMVILMYRSTLFRPQSDTVGAV